MCVQEHQRRAWEALFCFKAMRRSAWVPLANSRKCLRKPRRVLALSSVNHAGVKVRKEKERDFHCNTGCEPALTFPGVLHCIPRLIPRIHYLSHNPSLSYHEASAGSVYSRVLRLHLE